MAQYAHIVYMGIYRVKYGCTRNIVQYNINNSDNNKRKLQYNTLTKNSLARVVGCESHLLAKAVILRIILVKSENRLDPGFY